jgi:SAM-dependent methyltransferase
MCFNRFVRQREPDCQSWHPDRSTPLPRKASMEAVQTGPREDWTRQFYEARSQEYADATRNRALTPLLIDFSTRIPSGSVLDLGCGAGYDLAALRSRGHSAIGLDYAAPIAKIAKATSEAPVVVADMRIIPFGGAVFNGIWASASLLHLPRDDLPLALSEIKRVLKPGGLLFASVKKGAGDFRDANGRFFALYERDDWQQALMRSKFRTIDIAFNGGVQNASTKLPEQWMTTMAVSS